jgi:threonine dehydratase
MDLPNLNALLAAQAGIARWIKPTAQPALESLGEQLGLQLHIKQENRTPAGAFKVRGGLHYLQQQLARQPGLRGVIAASTGNHGRSIAFAARELGLSSAIVVPHHNNPQKNEAMRALGAELVEQGHDFQAALEYSMELAQQRGWHAVPSFHPDLVCGVASYGLELLQAIPDLDAVFVPVGLGSGFCGLAAARQALGHRAQLIAVVSAHAPAYALRASPAAAPIPWPCNGLPNTPPRCCRSTMSRPLKPWPSSIAMAEKSARAAAPWPWRPYSPKPPSGAANAWPACSAAAMWRRAFGTACSAIT